MKDETRIAKQALLEGQQAALNRIQSLLPAGVTEEQGAMLWDAVFFSQGEVGKMHGVCRATVNRLVAKHREAYEVMCDGKKRILESLGQSVVYLGMQKAMRYLASPECEVTSSKELSFVLSAVTQASKVANSMAEDAPARAPVDWKKLAENTPESMRPDRQEGGRT